MGTAPGSSATTRCQRRPHRLRVVVPIVASTPTRRSAFTTPLRLTGIPRRRLVAAFRREALPRLYENGRMKVARRPRAAARAHSRPPTPASAPRLSN